MTELVQARAARGRFDPVHSIPQKHVEENDRMYVYCTVLLSVYSPTILYYTRVVLFYYYRTGVQFYGQILTVCIHRLSTMTDQGNNTAARDDDRQRHIHAIKFNIA